MQAFLLLYERYELLTVHWGVLLTLASIRAEYAIISTTSSSHEAPDSTFSVCDTLYSERGSCHDHLVGSSTLGDCLDMANVLLNGRVNVRHKSFSTCSYIDP